MTDPSPPSTRADLLRALVLVGALTLWNYASDLVSSHLQSDAMSLTSPTRIGLILGGATVSVGGIVGLGCVVWGRRPLRALGWTHERAPWLALQGLGVTALGVGLVFGAYAAMAGLDGVRGLATAIASIPLPQRVFYLVMGAKVAFVEETIFRGDLLERLRSHVGVAGAVLISSALFAFFHRTLEPLPLFMKLLFGLVFAVATIRSGSLWPAAIGHTLMWTIVGDN